LRGAQNITKNNEKSTVLPQAHTQGSERPNFKKLILGRRSLPRPLHNAAYTARVSKALTRMQSSKNSGMQKTGFRSQKTAH
jgi:hypothetical protein